MTRSSGQATRGAQATLEPVAGGTIHAILEARAESDPDAPAILAPDRTPLSAGALSEQLNSIRRFLNERGLGCGDRVAVLAGLGPEAAVAALGITGGAICIPINPMATPELESALAETRADALLAPTGAETPVREAVARHGIPLLEGTVSPGADAGLFDLEGGTAGTAARPGPAGADDVALVLRTSGTTSTPKLVPSTHGQLLARAAKTSHLLGVTAGDRSLCPMPLCYAHGLYSGLTTGLAAGGSSILPPRFDEQTFMRCLEQLAPTWLTAGATHHQAILGWLRKGDADVGHRLRFARSGAASLPHATLEELEALLGVPVVEAYSSSETGIITANPPHGRRKPGSVGLPSEGDLEVRDEQGSVAPPGVSGEIVVRGPGVFSGYERNEELNRRSFSGDWFRIGDLGVVDEDGYLTLGGRIDDVINRGGEKVSPAEVERALLEHPQVAEAVAFAMPHPTLGADLATAVRLEPGGAVGEAELRGFAAGRLAPFKVPRRVVAVPELPTGPTGKPVREKLAEHLGLLAEPAGGVPEPARAGPLEEMLTGFWGGTLERDDVGPDDDFFHLGGDSLSAVELLAALEEELNVGLDLNDLIEAPTPRRLARSLARGSYLDAHRPEAGREAIGVNTTGTRPPLFAVGGRPGYALRTLLVGREVHPDQPVYGLQPPGMDWTSAGIRTIPEIAEHYLGLVRAVQPRGPYRLLGISFGGLVVFEMAVQLERAAEEVEFLGLVDTEPASCSLEGHVDVAPAPRPPTDAATPDATRGPIVAAGTRVAAVHVDARHSYVIESRVRSDLTFFRCTGEGVIAQRDRRRLWAEATSGHFRLLGVPGLHAKVDREPQFSALRDALRSCLDEAPFPGLDPADVFDRAYVLEGESGSETIRDGAGSAFRVVDGAMHGRVRSIKPARDRLLVRGWASDAGRQRAGETVVAFIDGRYAGYSTCGVPSEKLEQRHSAPGLRYAGFRMRLELPPEGQDAPLPRVFALAPDGRASELPVSS